MAVSAGLKSLLSAGVWAASGDRRTPAGEGLDRSVGWPESYEQPAAEEYPERAVFNQRLFEVGAAVVDIAARSVPAWDAAVDYQPTDDAHCFVTTRSGLHVSLRASGPGEGGPVNPDSVGQDAWRVY